MSRRNCEDKTFLNGVELNQNLEVPTENIPAIATSSSQQELTSNISQNEVSQSTQNKTTRRPDRTRRRINSSRNDVTGTIAINSNTPSVESLETIKLLFRKVNQLERQINSLNEENKILRSKINSLDILSDTDIG